MTLDEVLAESEPREWWISHEIASDLYLADANDEAHKSFNNPIKVIEKSAYDALKAENEKLRKFYDFCMKNAYVMMARL